MSRLVEELAGAETFEDSATVCLRSLLDATRAWLGESRHAADARLLRAIAHLRPDGGGYQALAVLEEGERRVTPAEGDAFLISTGAWQAIAAGESAAAIDTRSQALETMAGLKGLRPPEPSAAVGPQTLVRLYERGATHVYVLPLRGPGARPIGMVSVEVDCPKASGLPFIWEDAHPDLQLVVDIAGPFFAQLKTAAAAGEELDVDEHLPVIGSTMAPRVKLASVFARQDETLLISGPTGTGKSRLARWCHERSPRRRAPFEVLDLLSVPEDMQMGELFGWCKGAFTGATSDHKGSVSRAEGGTLFIDEIDKLSSRAQAGLLYLLEERRYRVLGDETDHACDVRFLVGTNADLGAEVAATRFREDLYFRINVLAVSLPPLAERTDEIREWARFMLERRHREARGPGAPVLSDDAARLLEQAPWPGNLRQLDNVVRRAYVLANAEGGGARALHVEEPHVRDSLLAEGTPGSGIPANPLREAAARFVDEALRRSDGLDLDLLTGLRGFVLEEAIRRTGNKEDAFRLFRRDNLVKGRNHHKTLQREISRAADLSKALGVPKVDSPDI